MLGEGHTGNYDEVVRCLALSGESPQVQRQLIDQQLQGGQGPGTGHPLLDTQGGLGGDNMLPKEA